MSLKYISDERQDLFLKARRGIPIELYGQQCKISRYIKYKVLKLGKKVHKERANKKVKSAINNTTFLYSR